MINQKEIEKVNRHFAVGRDEDGPGVFHRGTGKRSDLYSVLVNEGGEIGNNGDNEIGRELKRKLSEQRLRGLTQGF